ncbi:hypothetical protein N825_25315 [Skermanella stibiiresistens SB22]|uniref:Uncharacterized protein n=1 Tax=Skermanella stibiiresistens SB22 TaxID=1385369 RepID=W9GVU8_9PROT|nr:hypothetical protein [Skermanella stibiiresistens]EWY36756.1 hypothetical protein N825_25315 [Skermanella stibiiresistens SB22]
MIGLAELLAQRAVEGDAASLYLDSLGLSRPDCVACGELPISGADGRRQLGLILPVTSPDGSASGAAWCQPLEANGVRSGEPVILGPWRATDAVRFGPPVGRMMGLASDPIEALRVSSLACMAAPVWSPISSMMLMDVEIPASVETVILVRVRGTEKTVERRIAERLAEKRDVTVLCFDGQHVAWALMPPISPREPARSAPTRPSSARGGDRHEVVEVDTSRWG